VIELITITDVRMAGLCASGARRWFEAYGLDFRDFVTNGIDAEVLLATGDAYALRVVEFTRSRRNG
jgi:hypothetical protein